MRRRLFVLLFCAVGMAGLLSSFVFLSDDGTSASSSGPGGSVTPDIAQTAPGGVDGREPDGSPITAPPAEANADKAGIPWLTTGGKDPKTVATTPEQYGMYQSLASCFPAAATHPTAKEMFTGKACEDAKMLAYLDTHRSEDVFIAVRAVHTERPEVFTICHNGAHLAGRKALDKAWRDAKGAEEKTRVMHSLLLAAGTACMGGFVHGSYDEVGLVDNEPDNFQAAANACMDLDEISGYCADGTGHAAWDATQDLHQAARMCAFWDTPDHRMTCAEGILMRYYTRKESDPYYTGVVSTPGFSIERWVKDIAEICTTKWPDDALPAGVEEGQKDGCYRGSPYLLFKPLFSVVQSANNDYRAVRDKVKPMLVALEGACNAYGEEGSVVCLRAFGTFVANVALFDREDAADLCSVLSREVEACKDRSAQRIKDAENGK